LFHWINEVGEYGAVNPAIRSLLDKAEEEDGLSPSDPELQEGCPDNSVLFSFGDSDITGLTVVIGLRFFFEYKDEDDED
jgi:hypothetical protein